MANARHSKAAEFIRSGIFNNLDSFAELESRINKIPEEKDRGDAFEIFIEAYHLPADPTGIDGIYETHDGDHPRDKSAERPGRTI